MDRDIVLILVGGLVGLLSSLLATLINFALERKRQNAQWQHEMEIRKSELRQKEIDDARNILEKSTREKMSKIVIPEGKLACFPSFTPITLSNKDHKRIEEVKAGDEVLSFDVGTKTITKGVVTAVKTDDVQAYIVVNDILHVTQSHGVFINLNGNIVSGPAGNLSLGHYLVDETEQKVLVTSLHLIIKHIKVFNLELESNKPFFASGILVGDLFSKGEPGCGKENVADIENAARKRKELRERLLRGEDVLVTDTLEKIEIRFPDDSVFDVEFPATLTIKELMHEIAQHFDLNLEQWSLCSSKGEIISENEFVRNIAYKGQAIVVPEGKLA